MMTKIQVDKRVQQILKQNANAFLNLSINEKVFSDIIDLFIIQRENNGKIITTGMGKAGIAMRKFSSTLCSLGFPSMYLHPGEASHGDLGLITTNDILFVASTSGKTREILEIMDLAKNKVKSMIGITSHIDSPVRNKADLIIDMGTIEEVGHLNIAPTTSILVMITLTDCIATIAAEKINLTKQEYGRYHHGGYLGHIARS